MTNPVENAARRFGEAYAIEWDSGRLGFDALHDAVAAEAADLGDLRGARVGLKAPRSAPEITRMFGLVLSGATVVLVGPREPDRAVAFLTERFNLIWSPQGRGAYAPSEDGRIVVLTSGSTGSPKAVVHTLESLMASARGAAQHLQFGLGKCWPVTLPMNHVGGLSIVFRALAGGGTVWLPEPPGNLEEAFVHATHISLVAIQLRRVLESGWPRPVALECALLGGSAFPQTLLSQARARDWPIVSSYGMSEMGSLVTATSPGEIGSCGRVLPGRRLRIAPEGDVEVSGRALFEGYLDGPSSGAWHNTGDLGRLDESGQLFIVGRRDNMFISGGENVHPEAIEAVLNDVAGVELAVVVDVPDPEFGARPVAFVKGHASPDDLTAAVRRSLPGFMVPDAIYPLPDELRMGLKSPRTELRRLAADRRA